MNPDTHLPHSTLGAYAEGSLPDGMSLLVASHLTFCPACRGAVASIECLCGGFLAEEPQVPAGKECLSRALSRLDVPAGILQDSAPPPSEPGSPLPAPLRERLGCAADQIRWSFRLPGLSEYRMDGFENEAVSLLRARPGVRIPSHTHSGEEATLVLTGQLRDGGRVYSRGDVAAADDHDDHRPEIIGSETCVCLIVLSGKLRFTGMFGRALNLLNG